MTRGIAPQQMAQDGNTRTMRVSHVFVFAGLSVGLGVGIYLFVIGQSIPTATPSSFFFDRQWGNESHLLENRRNESLNYHNTQHNMSSSATQSSDLASLINYREDVPEWYKKLDGVRKESSNTFGGIKDTLGCKNQTICITPMLQLKRFYTVRLCPRGKSGGVRAYALVKEGLLLHPRLQMVTNSSNADLVLWLPVSTNNIQDCGPVKAQQLIVIDESDGQGGWPEPGKHIYVPANMKTWYLAYFKRSYVQRSNGKFERYSHVAREWPSSFPMTYAIANAYVSPKFTPASDRRFDIVCTLRPNPEMATRTRVTHWMEEYVKLNNLVETSVVGELNSDSRTVISKSYFDTMHKTQILVTVNPAEWEGDFRLWESVATGALVMVDWLYVPHPFPLEHMKHVVFYDNSNKTELFLYLDYFRSNPSHARRIAEQGYVHAMTYHRTANMLDYVFRTTEVAMKQLKQRNIEIQNGLFDGYSWTGQYLNQGISKFNPS